MRLLLLTQLTLWLLILLRQISSSLLEGSRQRMNQMGLLSLSSISCLTRRSAQLLTASSKMVVLSLVSVMVSKPLLNQVFFHTETSRKLVRQVQPSSITMPTSTLPRWLRLVSQIPTHLGWQELRSAIFMPFQFHTVKVNLLSAFLNLQS